MLHDPVTGDPHHVDRADRNAPAGGRDAEDLTGVGARGLRRDDDPVTVGDDLLDLDLGVGEAVADQGEERPCALDPGGEPRGNVEAREVLREVIVDGIDIARVDQGAPEALDQLDVLLAGQMITCTVPPSTDQAAPET